MSADRLPERDRRAAAQDGQDDQGGLPPFVSTWGGFYRLVLLAFLGTVLLFYAVQAAFR